MGTITTGNIQGTATAVGHGAQATVQTIYTTERCYIRYTDITCPRRVALAERVTITVALTMRSQPESVAQQKGAFITGKVKVRLVAPGFELLNALEQTIVIEADEESPPVVFHLKPRDVGRHAIAIEFWQRGNLIVRAEAPIEVIAVAPHIVESALFASIGIDPRLSDVPPPDLSLLIFRDAAGRAQYTLQRNRAEIFRTETLLPTAPHTLMEQLYTEVQLNPTNQPGALDREQMERRLTTLGYILWDRLIPADLKRFYERERTQWQVVADGARRWSLLVQSNEADIPWELLRPYASGEAPWAEECWCRTFFFARWLLGAPNTGEYFAPLPNVSLANLATILPTTYPNLSTIAEERALFQHLISQYGWNDCSPQATETAVLARLATGGYTWLHATTPGDRFATTPPQPSALGLDHQQSLPYRMITGPQIRNALRSQRPAIVLTACHAEATGMPFSDLAGWATQLIGAGAGLFLAPHWSVDTECATIFSRTFYTTLLNRERPATSAEAVWYAREAIRRTGDPMWLAYRLFAHPNAVGWSA